MGFFKSVGHAFSSAGHAIGHAFSSGGSAVGHFFSSTLPNGIGTAANAVSNFTNNVMNTVLIKPILNPVLDYWQAHDPYVFPVLQKGLHAVQNWSYENRKWLLPVLITAVVLTGIGAGLYAYSVTPEASTAFGEFYSVASTSRTIAKVTCLFCAPAANLQPSTAVLAIPTLTSTPTATFTLTPTATFTPSPTSTPTFTPSPTNTPTATPKPRNSGGRTGNGSGAPPAPTACPSC